MMTPPSARISGDSARIEAKAPRQLTRKIAIDQFVVQPVQVFMGNAFADAGVVHQNVQAAVLIVYGLRQCCLSGAVVDWAAQYQVIAAGKLTGGGAGFVLIAVVGDDQLRAGRR